MKSNPDDGDKQNCFEGAAPPEASAKAAPGEGDTRNTKGRKRSKTSRKEELQKRRGANGRFEKKSDERQSEKES